jgi:hypothetical protein
MRLANTIAIAGFLAVFFAPAAQAEEPTPQAINAHAEFLAYAPAPPAPVKVCVVDTGVDLSTDAAGAVVERYSMFGGTLDDVGTPGIPTHGTFVAGIIASGLNDGASVGIWPRARIISVRAFPEGSGTTSAATYIQALNKCRDQGAKVINLSLSGLGTATGAELAQLENRIADMRDTWSINVVAAAGNSGGEIGYPGKFASSFTVGASNATRDLCSFSGRGPELDISAFGCGLYVSMAGGTLGVGDGTSFSAPVVSAALAALRGYSPGLGATAAEDLLTSTAREAGAGKVLDIAAAFHVAGLDGISATPAPASVTPAVAVRAAGQATVIETPSSAPTPSGDPLADLGVRKPRVRSANYRRGVLSIIVSGVPDFGRAIFTVDGDRYTRASGTLRVKRKRAPNRVSVAIDVPGLGRTAALKITVTSAKPKASGGVPSRR